MIGHPCCTNMVNDISDNKWAIMLCLDKKEEDWIFVTEDTGSCDWSLTPVLFDDINEAMSYANTFTLPGREENVMVVSYES